MLNVGNHLESLKYKYNIMKKNQPNLDKLFAIAVITLQSGNVEHSFNVVQAMYLKACDMLGKKPISERELKRKIENLKK